MISHYYHWITTRKCVRSNVFLFVTVINCFSNTFVFRGTQIKLLSVKLSMWLWLLVSLNSCLVVYFVNLYPPPLNLLTERSVAEHASWSQLNWFQEFYWESTWTYHFNEQRIVFFVLFITFKSMLRYFGSVQKTMHYSKTTAFPARTGAVWQCVSEAMLLLFEPLSKSSQQLPMLDP